MSYEKLLIYGWLLEAPYCFDYISYAINIKHRFANNSHFVFLLRGNLMEYKCRSKSNGY